MRKSILFAAVTALSFVASPVLAGDWGGSYKAPSNYNGHNNYSSGLVNVSPTVNLGNIGNGILAGSALLSGNSTGIGAGVLGTGTGLLGATTGMLNNIVGNVRKR